MRNPKHVWLVGIDDIPEDGLSIQVDSRDTVLLELLAQIADGSAGAVAGFASMQVSPWPTRLDIRGSLQAKVPLQCARCLDGYVQDLDRSFTQVLGRGGPRGGDDETLQLTSVDLDRSRLVGKELDLRAVLREELLLSLPVKPLCSDDCRGICAGCGVELNAAECTCAPQIDDRWAALAALKGRLGSD